VAEFAQRVAVMYAGRIIELTDVDSLFASPEHPYTVGLLGSIPRLYEEEHQLSAIEGTVPSPKDMPAGCHFHPRCPLADDICRRQAPSLDRVATGHRVACWKAPLAAHVL
jgi:peptide/nickel transport system ATP-binding protein/oligopeptide transport system ATP-binding protein